MSKNARVNSATRSKLARACGARSQRPLFEAFEPRVLFSTYAVTTVSDAPGHTGVSLRDAITSANGSPGADTIVFNIGAGTRIIALASALPAISDTVVIDGSVPPTTPPATPQVIEISGAAIPATSGASGLTITASNSGVQGLRITNFRSTSTGVGGNGIVVNGSGGSFVSNFIGIGADNLPHGNGGRGVLITGTAASGANDNFFTANTIANNGDDGIAVPTATGGALVSVGNEFSANSIYSNGGLGIDLEIDGVTANDNLDPDAGANGQQNYPVISNVTISGGKATLSGTINSTPNTAVTLNFYAGSIAGREGRIILSQFDNSNNPVPVTVTTDGTGTYTFDAAHLNTITVSPRDGSSLTSPTTTFITATATSSVTVNATERLNTSEFSSPVGIAAAPRVQGVYVRGTAWTDVYRRLLQTSNAGSIQYGFAILGGTEQHNELPWNNVNQVSIRFTEDVTVPQAALALTTSLGTAISVSGVIYDASTFTATFSLSRSLQNEKLTLGLTSASVVDTDANADGNVLDGEWTNPTGNPVTGGSAYPSGNGTAGGNFNFSIRCLPGDFDRNGSVSLADFSKVRLFAGKSNLGLFDGDANGDGQVTLADFSAVRLYAGKTTPF